MDERRPSTVRCLVVWCIVTLTTGAAASFAIGPLLSWAPDPGGPQFEELLTALAAGVATISLAWLWLTSTAVLVELAADARWSVPCPTPLRRALLAACGIALASGFSPAHAEPGSTDLDRGEAGDRPEIQVLIADLPLPDRAESSGDLAPGPTAGSNPTPSQDPPRRPARHRSEEPAQEPVQEQKSAPAPTPAPTLAPSPAATHGTVTVRDGDTLWAIAAKHLPAGASNASIADAVRQWHHLNKATLGPDPDLILPGQRLTPPDAT